MNSNAGFKLVRLPIIAEEDEEWTVADRIRKTRKTFVRKKDEPLHPAREGMDLICEMRKAQGEFVFAGQYQQRPSPIEGGIIKEEWLHWYDGELPEFSMIIMSWDTAEKIGVSNAFSCCVVLGICRNHKKIYLLDCFRGRLIFPDLLEKIKQMRNEAKEKYKPRNWVNLLIEDKSSGSQAIQILSTDPDYRQYIRIPDTASDKIDRLAGASAHVANGTVLFPSNAGPWWPDFKDELLNFPSTQFKDQCDAFAHGVNYAQKIVNRPEPRCTII